MSREKLFRDPVHDIIAFDLDEADDRLLLGLLDAPEVQRLRRIRQLGMANMAFPNQKGAYATVGYRFGKLMPHVTYATLDDNDNPATLAGLPLKQTSTTLGLRYELGTGAALKVEAQQVKPECTGKAGEICRGLLIANPNLGPERSDNVMIYSLAVDVVF